MNNYFASETSRGASHWPQLRSAIENGFTLVATYPNSAPAPVQAWPSIAVTPEVEVRAAPASKKEVAATVRRVKWSVRWYLDSIVLLAPDDRACTSLIPPLYDVLGPGYDALVDRKRNVSAAEGLLATARRLLSRPPENVLDFGCGSGLALGARNRPQFLLGWDASEVMRRTAADTGMTVLETKSLDSVPSGLFDAVISCYVLHLPGAPEGAVAAMRMLRTGGVLVGNLHHSADSGEITRACSGRGVRLEYQEHDPLHGDILAITHLRETK
ncbi:class I SAM-dependent DNA methyltransferase [Streptomyces cyaneofuscatus]|uniref:class I SAM-dependent DNA methyltransferase n=1 Tax=Streptomyces cyaneofuscatus TaxID=66883 RepID=UPI0036589683